MTYLFLAKKINLIRNNFKKLLHLLVVYYPPNLPVENIGERILLTLKMVFKIMLHIILSKWRVLE